MNEWLAQYFGTSQVSEETEKQASVELFVKLAADEGIDLNSMSNADVERLYAATMGKVAGTDEEEEERVEKARREHEEKKEGQAKFAEAVLMGQTMAHAMSAELDAIEQAKEAASIAGAREAVGSAARTVGGHARRIGGRFGELVSGSRARSLKKDSEGAAEVATGFRAAIDRLGGGSEVQKQLNNHLVTARSAIEGARKSEARKVLATRAGLGVAGGTAAAGGIAAAIHHHNKQASALDELAAESAVQKLAEAGFNADEAAERLGALLVLGVSDENSKVAFAQDIGGAVEVRSLELAELAGYPVTWTE